MTTTMTAIAGQEVDTTAEAGMDARRVDSADRAKVLGGLCHSLNQPLMAISGLSEIMAMQMAEEDPLKPKMVKLVRQVEKMSGIVRDIMEVSKRM